MLVVTFNAFNNLEYQGNSTSWPVSKKKLIVKFKTLLEFINRTYCQFREVLHLHQLSTSISNICCKNGGWLSLILWLTYYRSEQSIKRRRNELSQQVSLSSKEGESGRLEVRLTASLQVEVQIKDQVSVPFEAVKSRKISQKIKVWLQIKVEVSEVSLKVHP